jgi:hypothetical protein
MKMLFAALHEKATDRLRTNTLCGAKHSGRRESAKEAAHSGGLTINVYFTD